MRIRDGDPVRMADRVETSPRCGVWFLSIVVQKKDGLKTCGQKRMLSYQKKGIIAKDGYQK